VSTSSGGGAGRSAPGFTGPGATSEDGSAGWGTGEA
jgi:hypothetical protein